MIDLHCIAMQQGVQNAARLGEGMRSIDREDLPLVLIVEDEPATRALLAGYFEAEGFLVSEAETAAEARMTMLRTPPDLILLDISLPDEDGLSLARSVRDISNIGIIMVSRHADDGARVAGLETGGDDYVVKPANPRELLARARNLLRRTNPTKMHRAEGVVYRFDGWLMDPARRLLWSPASEQARLTRGEFELLGLLVRSGGRIVTRDQLIDVVSGTDRNPTDRTIDVLVSRLRRKLTLGGSDDIIVTEKGFGYRLAVEVQAEQRGRR
jgi:DNA-binding response OmpR family regulator